METRHTFACTVWGALLGAVTWVISLNVHHLFFFTDVFGGAPGGLSDKTILAFILGSLVGAVAGLVGGIIIQQIGDEPILLVLGWAVVGAAIGFAGFVIGAGRMTGAVLGIVVGVVGGILITTPSSEDSDVVRSPGWLFLLLWVLAGAVGWAISITISRILGLVSYDVTMEAFFKDMVSSILDGAVIGTLQWVVLRRYLRHSGRWILAWSAGAVIGGVFVEVLRSNMWIMGNLHYLGHSFAAAAIAGAFGTGVGMTQWFLLRRRVRWALLWIPVTIIAVAISDVIRDAVFSPYWNFSLIHTYMAVVGSGALTELIVGTLLVCLLHISDPSRSTDREQREQPDILEMNERSKGDLAP